jgi:nicotinamidase/pyrazinamidase
MQVRDGDMLGLIDVQPTFMPGGELPVPDGDAVVPVINALRGRFTHAFATQDWHPPGHLSFASAHPGRVPYEEATLAYGPQTLWPDHALQGSPGAALHAQLDTRPVELILRKGFRPGIDSYSAFQENDRSTQTGLHEWLQARSVRRLFLAGLALDFCVAWSAQDAVARGYQVVVVADACRGIDLPGAEGGSVARTLRQFRELGVSVLNAAELS